MSAFRTQYTVAFSDIDLPDEDPIFDFTFDSMPPIHDELNLVNLWIRLGEPDNLQIAEDYQIVKPPDIGYYIVMNRGLGIQGISVTYTVKKVDRKDFEL